MCVPSIFPTFFLPQILQFDFWQSLFQINYEKFTPTEMPSVTHRKKVALTISVANAGILTRIKKGDPRGHSSIDLQFDFLYFNVQIVHRYERDKLKDAAVELD